jgi:type III secretory pathway component EscR
MMIQRKNILLFSSNDSENEESSSSAKSSLEEKMKAWEATEEEVKAATLGGVVPGGQNAERSDAFDVGLYILFPFMVVSGLAVALFPFIAGNLDLDSLGPPPTQ